MAKQLKSESTPVVEVQSEVNNSVDAASAAISALTAAYEQMDQCAVMDEATGLSRLPDPCIEATLIAITGEPLLMSMAKDAARQGLRLGKRPEHVSIPTTETGTYELWMNPEIRPAIEQSLKTAGKENLIGDFQRRESYDKYIAQWDERAKTTVDALRKLSDALNQTIVNLGGAKPAAVPAPKTRGTTNKSRKGDPGLFYLESPIDGDNYINHAQQEAWVIKNAKERINARYGIDYDTETLKRRVFQVQNGERVYINA